MRQKKEFLSKVIAEYILDRENLADALGWRLLASRLVKSSVPENDIRELIRKAFDEDNDLLRSVELDLIAVTEGSCCNDFLSPFLYFKGFQALSCYRVANYLWRQNRNELALYLQSLIAVVYSVDIHPAASIGHGILLDHATGFVAGETTVIENDVSILHEVT